MVLVIDGTLESEAMFCSSGWLSGWQGSPVRALLEVLLVMIGLWALGVGRAMLGGTLGSRAGFCTLGSAVLCSGNWFIGWPGPSGSAMLCSSNWFSGWFVGIGARLCTLGSKAPFSSNWLSDWQGL